MCMETRIGWVLQKRTPPPHRVYDHASKNIPEVKILDPLSFHNTNDSGRYVFPIRHNRGKPPNRYSPDKDSRGDRYSIAHYTSTQRLSEPLKAFAHKLSTEYTPNTAEEAMKDPKWTQAIMEEMTALQKNQTWTLVPLP